MLQFWSKNWTWEVKFVPPSPMVIIGAVLLVREAGLMFSVARRHSSSVCREMERVAVRALVQQGRPSSQNIDYDELAARSNCR